MNIIKAGYEIYGQKYELEMNVPSDRTDRECLQILFDCLLNNYEKNGTGKLSEVKPKADVRRCIKCGFDLTLSGDKNNMCWVCKQKEAEPKADVRGVELTEKEKMFLVHEYNLNGYSLLGVLKEIESIITSRLTALQSAHEEEVKELNNRIEIAEDALWDMWEQHAYTGKSKGKDIIYTGGLSANESCEGYFLRYNLIDDTGHKITLAIKKIVEEGK